MEARFDTSGYVVERPLPKGANKKVLGMMKDELGGRIMTEFVGLKSKMYSYKVLGDSEGKRCKGIKKCVVKRCLRFQDYKRCLKYGKNVYKSQMSIQSHKHVVCSEVVNKIALNRDDDKRLFVRMGLIPLLGVIICWGNVCVLWYLRGCVIGDV